MNERAISFGESGALFGILTAPDVPDPQRPAVLIPNTGVVHRVGPGRMHVELARALAAAGVVSLRIDGAGLGDSEQVPGRNPDAAPDLCAAMDALDARNIARGHVLIGGHNGAHEAHLAARIDPRVIGAVFIDGYVHSTPRAWLNRTLQRFGGSQRLQPEAPRTHLQLTPRSGEALHDAADADIHWFDTPPHARMNADLVEFMRRQMALMYIYTGDVERDYQYSAQLIDAFPLLRGYRRLTVRHLPEADHRHSRRVTREALIDVLVDWTLKVSARPAG